MTQEVETPTREQFEEELAERQDQLAEAQLNLEAAYTALEEVKGRKNIDTMKLVELATAVNDTVEAEAFAEKLVVKAQSNLDNFEALALRGQVNQATVAVAQAVKDALEPHLGLFRAAKVTKVSIGPVEIGEGIPAVDIKAHGPTVTTRTPRAGNGSGVGRSRYTYVHNGSNYTSRELVATFGPAQLTGKVTAEMVLAEPTKHGLTHKADAIAKAIGADKVAL